jgi:hypothetical protein
MYYTAVSYYICCILQRQAKSMIFYLNISSLYSAAASQNSPLYYTAAGQIVPLSNQQKVNPFSGKSILNIKLRGLPFLRKKQSNKDSPVSILSKAKVKHHEKYSYSSSNKFF